MQWRLEPLVGRAAIELGRQRKLYVGNLDARRDWGHARDYADGMWRILQHTQPDDFVLATGESHSVREFIELILRARGRWDALVDQYLSPET